MARLAEQGIYSTKGAEHLGTTVRAGTACRSCLFDAAALGDVSDWA